MWLKAVGIQVCGVASSDNFYLGSECGVAQQLVANTLTFLGYEPVWQEVFGTEAGDLGAVLPDNAEFVAAQVTFKDGSTSPVQKFVRTK